MRKQNTNNLVHEAEDFRVFEVPINSREAEGKKNLIIEHVKHVSRNKAPTGIAVLPINKEGEIVLKANKYPATTGHHFSAIETQVKDETEDEAVRRALIDEMELTSDELIYLGRVQPKPDLLYYQVGLYVAKPCLALPAEIDSHTSKDFETKTMSVVDALKALRKDEFHDLTTSALVSRYLLEELTALVAEAH